MNEFIVWDKEKKDLYTPNQMNFNDKGEHIKTDRFEWCQYIGLKDINNKKIYADCSIVEWKDFDCKRNGYFTYNKKFLRYELIVLYKDELINLEFFYVSHFKYKIIDTIQENKLGLIK